MLLGLLWGPHLGNCQHAHYAHASGAKAWLEAHRGKLSITIRRVRCLAGELEIGDVDALARSLMAQWKNLLHNTLGVVYPGSRMPYAKLCNPKAHVSDPNIHQFCNPNAAAPWFAAPRRRGHHLAATPALPRPAANGKSGRHRRSGVALRVPEAH